MINTMQVYFSLTQRPIWIFLFWQFSWVAFFQAMSQGSRLLPPWDTSNFNPGPVKAEENIGKTHWVLNLLSLEVTLTTSVHIPLACCYHLAPRWYEESGKYKPWLEIFGVQIIGSATSLPNDTYDPWQIKCRILGPLIGNVSIIYSYLLWTSLSLQKRSHHFHLLFPNLDCSTVSSPLQSNFY